MNTQIIAISAERVYFVVDGILLAKQQPVRTWE